jgi:hypothetical protein
MGKPDMSMPGYVIPPTISVRLRKNELLEGIRSQLVRNTDPVLTHKWEWYYLKPNLPG